MTQKHLPVSISPNGVLWVAYLALLAVLAPHTAWAFSQSEPVGIDLFGAHPLGWLAALAFEATIAALTWKLQKALSKRKKDGWQLALFISGLFLFSLVSTWANWLHAEEFGKAMLALGRYSLPPITVSLAFGAALPVASFLFALILAPDISEDGEDPQIAQAKAEIRETKRQLAETNKQLEQANTRNATMQDIAVALFAPVLVDRIHAIKTKWPTMPVSGVAVLAGASVSHTSEVLNGK